MTSAAEKSALVIVRAGLHTTVQDGGRWGYQHLGVPVGGALDLDALHHANTLVGNAADEAGLEVTLVGCTLRADGPLQVAVTGARFDLAINGVAQAPDVVLTLASGDELALGQRRRGARAYVAVRGGIDGPVVLGSRSAWPLLPRRGALMDGDRLLVGHRAIGPASTRRWPARPTSSILRVLPGPDVGSAERALDVLCANAYRLLPSASRMAYPLDGAAVPLAVPDRASSGTVGGAVQILPSGLPVLLMAERQTTGGYPVAAVVIGSDMRHAAQLAPGDTVRFRPTTRLEAMRAWREAEARCQQEA